ncbi:MAG TPA: iron-containing alcohol dehydrogenase [Candidatus Merdenecus merdavium]|nr:iron-containing alcohol dehydrogenase [Candidatus Merdenecus merdavium]
MDTFKVKTEIKFGQNALEYLKTIRDQKILIVTDPFMVQSNLIGKVTEFFTAGNYHVFSDIVPDPPVELVAKGVTEAKAFAPDVILALGGGSAIDAAKAIKDLAMKIGNLKDITFIAIPTTSGTGSEVTSFAVITDQEKGRKYPLISDELLPDIAILEPELVKSVPPATVADTGMDVLTHAIEAYVSTKATDFSDAFAEKAAQLVFQYLKRSYDSADDLVAKEKMHHASCLAGLAFNMASLGLNHAMAHNIGGKLHVPHGRTNAILLPYIIEFNANIEGYNQTSYSEAAKKYARLAHLIGFGGGNVRSGVKNLMNEIKKLEKSMEMPSSILECNVTKDQFASNEVEIALGALEDSTIDTNPRMATKEDILSILHEIV